MLKIVRESVLKVGRSLGYDLVSRKEMQEHDFALRLRALLDSQHIDCVLDIGAHLGQYRDFLRERVRYDGPIVSFEPVGRHIEFLRTRSRADGNWHVEGYALGSRSGALPIDVSADDQPPDLEDLEQPCRTELVAVRTLDQILPTLRQQLGFFRPYLKIGTQGFDMEPLRGAERSLPSISALQTEVPVIDVQRGLPRCIDTIRYLNERGFELAGFYPVIRDRGLRRIEFDCVMTGPSIIRRCAATSLSPSTRRPADW